MVDCGTTYVGNYVVVMYMYAVRGDVYLLEVVPQINNTDALILSAAAYIVIASHLHLWMTHQYITKNNITMS